MLELSIYIKHYQHTTKAKITGNDLDDVFRQMKYLSFHLQDGYEVGTYIAGTIYLFKNGKQVNAYS